jgi:hypothetical protein
MRRIQKIREWSIWLVLLFVGFGAGFWLATTETVSFAAPRNSSLLGVPPAVVSYQGVIDINGNSFTGTGYFKFALVDSPTGDGSVNYWANDGTLSGAPANAVQLAVNNGLFDVLLGDTSLANMSTPFDETAVAETVTYLRVWFSETGAGGSFEALEPNQRLASVPYALQAGSAPSGVVSANFVNGFGGNPGSIAAFLSPAVTVSVGQGQSIFVVGTKPLGTTTGAGSLDLYPCYRVAGTSDVPTIVGDGMLNMSLNGGQRIPMTLSGVFSDLAPGDYEVGICGDDDGNGNWDNNEWGYTSALVLRTDEVGTALAPLPVRMDHE